MGYYPFFKVTEGAKGTKNPRKPPSLKQPKPNGQGNASRYSMKGKHINANIGKNKFIHPKGKNFGSVANRNVKPSPMTIEAKKAANKRIARGARAARIAKVAKTTAGVGAVAAGGGKVLTTAAVGSTPVVARQALFDALELSVSTSSKTG